MTVVGGTSRLGNKTNGSLFLDSPLSTSVPISAIYDGTSQTIACIEDAGRVGPQQGVVGVPYVTFSSYADTYTGTFDPSNVTSGALLQHDQHAGPRRAWRWADPDAGGSGLSGPYTNDDSGNDTYTGKVINQHAYPIGGDNPSATAAVGAAPCSWNNNNCGANNEPFSFHNGGCNSVFVDGSVKFLSDTLDPVPCVAWLPVRKASSFRPTRPSPTECA